ncbi:type 1 fimbrial protein, partial [Salmonella enterica subsp. enterica]|nr:type 1 fimbrial protein [Salmonella enterica subsp. enterica serovar Farmsen]
AIITLSSILSIPTIHAAGNGTINFTGVVNSQTCNATINSASTATLTLPTVQASVLGTAGSTAEQTAFNVAVTGCAATNPSGAGSVKVFFEKGPNVDSNGRLINTETSGGASNVSL